MRAVVTRPERIVVAGAVAVTVALAALGCRREPADPVAAAVAAGVREQLGVAVAQVRCGHDRCEVRLADGPTLAVRVTGDGAVTWESDEVIRTAPLAAYVRDELAGLGITATVDCGPALLVATAAPRITCTFAGGAAHGAAWLDLAPDGGLALELALDDEAVRASTEVTDPAGLDELSRALDTDDAEGAAASAEDDDGPGDTDAGVADGGRAADAQGS